MCRGELLIISVENVNNALRNGIQNEIPDYVGFRRRGILIHVLIWDSECFKGRNGRLFEVSKRSKRDVGRTTNPIKCFAELDQLLSSLLTIFLRALAKPDTELQPLIHTQRVAGSPESSPE